jgi:hypothetical protein
MMCAAFTLTFIAAVSAIAATAMLIEEHERSLPSSVLVEFDPARVVSFLEVSAAIKRDLGVDPLLTDDAYIVPPLSEYERFLEADTTNELRYRDRVFDCDDFALTLMLAARLASMHAEAPAALGIAILAESNRPGAQKNHALNAFLDASMRVLCVEPQTDAISNCSFATNVIL